MASNEDLILSCIHSSSPMNSNKVTDRVTTPFHYVIPIGALNSHSVQHEEGGGAHNDTDGDYDPPRLPSQASTSRIAYIEHKLATPLELVGTQVTLLKSIQLRSPGPTSSQYFQSYNFRQKLLTFEIMTRLVPIDTLWSGSLLLADYILHNNDQFRDSIVIELGSGVGLVGIVSSLLVKHIFCTDRDVDVLELCEKNIITNCAAIEGSSNVPNVSVKVLNWMTPTITTHDNQRYSWEEGDVNQLKKASYIIAADVIYDDELTEAFLSTLSYLVSSILEAPPTVIITTERRIVYTLEDLNSTSPSHDYFFDLLNVMYTNFKPEKLSTTLINQYFEYERTKELEIWTIKFS